MQIRKKSPLDINTNVKRLDGPAMSLVINIGMADII
jgi:hypothetical protein